MPLAKYLARYSATGPGVRWVQVLLRLRLKPVINQGKEHNFFIPDLHTWIYFEITFVSHPSMNLCSRALFFLVWFLGFV
jgi:hypothetical protein